MIYSMHGLLASLFGTPNIVVLLICMAMPEALLQNLWKGKYMSGGEVACCFGIVS